MRRRPVEVAWALVPHLLKAALDRRLHAAPARALVLSIAARTDARAEARMRRHAVLEVVLRHHVGAALPRSVAHQGLKVLTLAAKLIDASHAVLVCIATRRRCRRSAPSDGLRKRRTQHAGPAHARHVCIGQRCAVRILPGRNERIRSGREPAVDRRARVGTRPEQAIAA